MQLATRDAVEQQPVFGPWHTFEVAFGRTVEPGGSLREQGDPTLWMRGAKPKIRPEETDLVVGETLDAIAARSQSLRSQPLTTGTGIPLAACWIGLGLAVVPLWSSCACSVPKARLHCCLRMLVR